MTITIRSVTELLITGGLIGLSVYDVLFRKVRNGAILLFLPVVLLKGIPVLCRGSPAEILSMLSGVVAGFGILLSAAVVTHGGVGGGDIKLAAVLGLASGFDGMLFLLGIAAAGAMLVGLNRKLKGKKEAVRLPFVPFLTLGYAAAWLTGIC